MQGRNYYKKLINNKVINNSLLLSRKTAKKNRTMQS